MQNGRHRSNRHTLTGKVREGATEGCSWNADEPTIEEKEYGNSVTKTGTHRYLSEREGAAGNNAERNVAAVKEEKEHRNLARPHRYMSEKAP